MRHAAVGRDFQDSLAFGLGKRLLTKELGIHLEREADALTRLIIDTLRWTPPAQKTPIVPAQDERP